MAERAVDVLEGKVALITGASRGLGEAIARRFAAEGANVVISARTFDPDPRYQGSLSEVAASIEAAGGTVLPVVADISKHEDRVRMVEAAKAAFGPVDILVNNAAVTWLLPFEEFPEKRWRLMVEVQMWAPFELSQLVVPDMVAKGRGWILNITSRSAQHPQGPPYDEVHLGYPWAAYGMVKAALDRFSTALAAELYDERIAVNALGPWDNVATPGASGHDLTEGFRLEGPEWVAEAALALCSGDPKALTGRVAYSQPLLAELKIRPRTVEAAG